LEQRKGSKYDCWVLVVSHKRIGHKSKHTSKKWDRKGDGLIKRADDEQIPYVPKLATAVITELQKVRMLPCYIVNHQMMGKVENEAGKRKLTEEFDDAHPSEELLDESRTLVCPHHCLLTKT
jgi:hypothetical protein